MYSYFLQKGKAKYELNMYNYLLFLFKSKYYIILQNISNIFQKHNQYLNRLDINVLA